MPVIHSWKQTPVVAGTDFVLTLGEAWTAWKQRGFLKDLLRKAVIDKLLRRAAQQGNVTLTVEELQAGADNFRNARGLHSAERTEAWLRKHGLTADDLQAAVERELLIAKLLATLPVSGVEAYFAREADQFARARLRQIMVSSAAAAHELLHQIAEEGADFSELARTTSLDPMARTNGGELGVLQRRELPSELAEAVFASAPGKVVGPISTNRGVHLVLVEELLSAELDTQASHFIRERLFHTWLRHQLTALHLEYLIEGQA